MGKLGDYFDLVHESFLAAEQAADDCISRSYAVAGYPIELRFAGSTLESLLAPALAHLETGLHASDALTIGLWCGDPMGSGMPAPPLPPAIMAPAWPIRRPGGAVTPAMKPAIGLLAPRDW